MNTVTKAGTSTVIKAGTEITGKKNILEETPWSLEKCREYSRKYEYYIRSTDTDPHDELWPFALMSMIQEAACLDADYHGLGALKLDKEGYCWLLLRSSLRLNAIPKWKDTLTIDTWTNGVERLFSIRDFALTDQNGFLLGKASTSWLVVDKEGHRPKKIDILNDSRVMEPSISALGYNSPKLDETIANFPEHPVISKYADYSEIDRNYHVNNTRYIAWCLDAVGKTGIPPANFTGIDINYISEVRPGEEIDIYMTSLPVEKGFDPDAKDVRMIAGRHRDSRKTAFIAILYWDSVL